MGNGRIHFVVVRVRHHDRQRRRHIAAGHGCGHFGRGLGCGGFRLGQRLFSKSCGLGGFFHRHLNGFGRGVLCLGFLGFFVQRRLRFVGRRVASQRSQAAADLGLQNLAQVGQHLLVRLFEEAGGKLVQQTADIVGRSQEDAGLFRRAFAAQLHMLECMLQGACHFRQRMEADGGGTASQRMGQCHGRVRQRLVQAPGPIPAGRWPGGATIRRPRSNTRCTAGCRCAGSR